MGPSEEEAMQLVREARGGSGRKRREIDHGINKNNLIEVDWLLQHYFMKCA